MNEVEELEKAIAALEGQRQALGDAVVDAALKSMREKLAALNPTLGSEQRKLVTVLFSDLVGFTAMSEKMDPEDMQEILAEYFEVWRAAIEQHGGVVEKFIGDAVMAVFGLSAAQENDAERAVRAALEAQESLNALNQELEQGRGVRLAMRVGIHTGLVVVSTLEERYKLSGRQDFVAVGDTVNLASRLQSAAPSGGILISHDTYRHVRGAFDVQALEAVQLKGKSEPVQVYLVKRAKPRAFRTGTRGVEGIETRMVGREAELKLLQKALVSAIEDGERQVVTLVGDAGMGKSRLLFEFSNWLELLPEVILFFKGRASPYSQNQPFSLLRDLFSFRFQIQDSDPPKVVREKLERGFEEEVAAHFIGQLLGFDFGDSPHLQGVRDDAKQLRSRALAYLSQYFKRLATQNPVVVLLEDLHWADDSSLDLVNVLGQEFAGLRLLIMGAARPTLFERRPHWGEGLTFVTRVELERLSPRDSRRLVGEILQKVEHIPASLHELIVEQAEGNPFYIEEFIKMLIEDGVIIKGEENWSVETDRLEDIRVPPTLTGVLQARLDSLQPEERALLQCASVVGRVFWDQVVKFMRENVPSTTPRQAAVRTVAGDTKAALSSLRAREIVYQREQSVFQDTQEYLFKHVLMRDVTYESLLKRVRRIYHAQAGRWLEKMTQQSQRVDEYAMLIAEHYEQASEAGPAAAWYRRAGQRAASLFANPEALHAFERALELLPEGDLAGRFDLLLEREKVHDLLGARESQVRDLQDMEALAEEMPDQDRKARLALRQAQYAFLTGDYPSALAASQKAVELAHTANDEESEAAGHLLQASTLLRQGDFDPSRERAGRALALARQNSLRKIEANCLRHLGLIAYYTGNIPQALDYFEQALALYTEIGDRQGEGTAVLNLGGATFERGDYAKASAYYEQSLRLCREIGDRTGESRALNNLGITFVVQGDYRRAEESYLRALAINQAIGHRSFEASNLDNLGNLYLMIHEYAKSLQYHQQSLQVTREIGDWLPEVIGLLNMGDNYLALGDYSSAYQYLREALVLSRQLGNPQGESRVLDSLSRYYHLTGEEQAALDHAEKALTLAQEVGVQGELAGVYKCVGDALLGLERFSEAKEVYAKALAIRRELRETSHAMPVLAGLARACQNLGDPEGAQLYVEEILNDMDKTIIEGSDEPMHVYLTCYQVLQATGDRNAPAVLEKGYRLLEEWTGKMEDPEMRRNFLENVPANRELRLAWEKNTQDRPV